MFKKIKDYLSEKYYTHPIEKFIYLIGSFISYVTILILGFVSLFGGNNNFEQSIVYLIFVISLVGISIEIWKIGIMWLKKTWVKGLLGAISVLVYKFSVIQADEFINKLTGIEPSFFPFASSALSMFYLLPSWLMTITAVLSFFILATSLVLFLSHFKKEKESESFNIMRVLGMISVCIITINITSFLKNPNSKSLGNMIAKGIVLSTEYFPNSYCKGIKDSQIVADLGRGYVSIFDKSKDAFYVKKCEVLIGD